MAITLAQVQATKKELEPDYEARHEAFRRLRDIWSGRNLWNTNRKSSDVSAVFRDLIGESANVGPDLKMHIPIIQEVCTRYQSFLSPLPMIRVYVDPPETENRRNQATKKERYLYGTWNQRPLSMKDVLNKVAWFLPLMGDAFLGTYPDIQNKIIRPVLRSPEYAYPIPSYDGSSLDAVAFCWKVPESRLARQFPKYQRQSDQNAGRFRFVGRRKQRQESEPQVEIIEYSDRNEFARWAGDQKLNGVEHNYGFNLFDQLQFIHVPGEPWGHGAVEQAVTMAEGGDILYSMLMHAVMENVFPRLILEDPSKFPEDLDSGPGAVIGVNPGGKAYFLSPPAQAFQTGFMSENERMIKQATSMPDASFGGFPGGVTHVSGKAINEMQGAGTGSMVEMVQGTGIGSGMVSFNEKAIILAQKMLREETINLAGFETGSAIEINPRYFTINVKGSELVGSCRNEVIFSPHLGLHEKLVMNLQAMGAGLVSREHSRNQLGIPDSQAMDDEILGEKIQEIVVGAIEQELMSQPTPENAMSAEQRGIAYINSMKANAPELPPPPPAPPTGAPGQGPPGGPPIAEAGGGGQVMAPALQLPEGSPLAPAPAGPQGPPPDANRITLDEAVKAFQGVKGIRGRVFLVGEIVQSGETSDDIEVALTDKTDKQTLSDALPRFAGRLTFHVVPDEPSGAHAEVSPGAAPEAKGTESEPDLASLLA